MCALANSDQVEFHYIVRLDVKHNTIKYNGMGALENKSYDLMINKSYDLLACMPTEQINHGHNIVRNNGVRRLTNPLSVNYTRVLS